MAALGNDVALLGGVFTVANRAEPCVSHIAVQQSYKKTIVLL